MRPASTAFHKTITLFFIAAVFVPRISSHRHVPSLPREAGMLTSMGISVFW